MKYFLQKILLSISNELRIRIVMDNCSYHRGWAEPGIVGLRPVGFAYHGG